MIKLFVIAIAVACLFACMPGVSATNDHSGNGVPQSTGDHTITETQAKDSVRNFMGDKSLEPVYKSRGSSHDVPCYVMVVKNSTFWVNTDTGVVEFAEFLDAMPQSPPEIKINLNEAYAKAVKYIGQTSDISSNNTWLKVVGKMAGPSDGIRGYVFAFQEETGNKTLLLPHIVIASLNPDTGAIIHYMNWNSTSEDQSFSNWRNHLDENITAP
ncbi:MAG: hypothetical protein WC626_05840 [Methanoregula sp.]